MKLLPLILCLFILACGTPEEPKVIYINGQDTSALFEMPTELYDKKPLGEFQWLEWRTSGCLTAITTRKRTFFICRENDEGKYPMFIRDSMLYQYDKLDGNSYVKDSRGYYFEIK